MTPIQEFLEKGILPQDKGKARRLKEKASQYTLIGEVLYKKAYLSPYLSCVVSLQVDYVMREVHEGACSLHAGLRSVVAKAMQIGYYWPIMHEDAREMIKWCEECLMHKPIPRHPRTELKTITTP